MSMQTWARLPMIVVLAEASGRVREPVPKVSVERRDHQDQRQLLQSAFRMVNRRRLNLRTRTWMVSSRSCSTSTLANYSVGCGWAWCALQRCCCSSCVVNLMTCPESVLISSFVAHDRFKALWDIVPVRAVGLSLSLGTRASLVQARMVAWMCARCWSQVSQWNHLLTVFQRLGTCCTEISGTAQQHIHVDTNACILVIFVSSILHGFANRQFVTRQFVPNR